MSTIGEETASEGWMSGVSKMPNKTNPSKPSTSSTSTAGTSAAPLSRWCHSAFSVCLEIYTVTFVSSQNAEFKPVHVAPFNRVFIIGMAYIM